MNRPRSTDIFYKNNSRARTAGCLFGVFWLFSLLCSLAFSAVCVAAIIALTYYLFTGEFICR